MSDWLERFKAKEEQTPTLEEQEEEFEDEFEDEEVQEMAPLGFQQMKSFDKDLDEIVEDISKTNGYIFASLKAMNQELKSGFTVIRSELEQRVSVLEGRVTDLETRVVQSLLAMEDGNEKRTLLLANALEEINDLVADPDGMTDVFKVAPDIAMGAIEREAQGELSDEKPFDPNDEIFLPENTDNELSGEQEFLSKIKIAELVDEEHPDLLNDEGGVGEIQMFDLPGELAEQGYTEESYNKVMDYINGDIKWKDIVKYAGGMKQAKALVDPVKASLDML